jgi:methylmalonyl-CoA/ethylmalonyl-CoA epimerase
MPTPEPDSAVDVAGVHHVGILVADLTAAEAFATGVLGLTVEKRASLPSESTELVFLRCGDVRIELIEVGDPEVRARRARVPGAAAEVEHVALAVEDVDAVAARLSGVGVRFTAGAGKLEESTVPLEVAGTRSLFSVRDSSAGFLLQLIEDPDQTQPSGYKNP